uniref:Complex I-B17 n=1 Tax=Macrostomum lignano TaxID=282301 RepID=A0A1I8IYQ5_9PLAT
MEKELYREALMRDYDLKRGSKYPPMYTWSAGCARNIFRRIWNAPFDALDRALTRTGLPLSATYGIRFALPKATGLAAIYALCLHLKVAPRTWETGVGMVVTQANAVTRMSVPGTAEWERFQNGEFYRSKESFDDLGFSKRSAMRDETLLTSAAGPQINGTV